MKAKGGKKGGGQQQQGGGQQQQQGAAPKPEATDPLKSPHLPKATQILDRMVNQNMFEEIAMDFKYWEDASDAFRCAASVMEMVGWWRH